jgi:hypothetical protein
MFTEQLLITLWQTKSVLAMAHGADLIFNLNE